MQYTTTTPCAKCGTTHGWRDLRSALPFRRYDLCRPCYHEVLRNGTLHLWSQPKQTYAIQLSALRAAKAALIAARMAHHETTGWTGVEAVPDAVPTPAPPALFDHESSERVAEAEAFAAQWLAAHPWQRASWDDARLAFVGPPSEVAAD